MICALCTYFLSRGILIDHTIAYDNIRVVQKFNSTVIQSTVPQVRGMSVVGLLLSTEELLILIKVDKFFVNFNLQTKFH